MTRSEEPRTRYLMFGTSRVRVRTEGTGAPLLLLMGIGGHLDMWLPLTEHLAGRRLVMFDFPCTGDSSLPWFPPTMAHAAAFVRRLTRRLGLHQVDVLGYSWGGLLAQQLAAQHSGAVRKLVLACTGPGVLAVPAGLRITSRLLTPRRYHSPGYLAAIAPDTFGGRFRHDPALVHAEVARRSSHPPSWPGYIFQLLAASTFSTFPLAPLIRQPTLILAGDDDPIVKTQNQRILHRLLRHSELRMLENAGHLLLLDSPENSAAADYKDRIRDFHACVCFDEYDLAEYGGRMFDKFEDAPETLRLTLWYQVEKSAGSPLEIILDSNEDKVGRIAAAQHEGRVSSTYPPVALLSLVRSTAMTWHTQIPELASLFPSDRRDRRDIVVRVIRQILDQ